MIRASKPNITNIRNGFSYGIMKNGWTENETKTFGNSLLYYALKKCIIEQPIPFFPQDLMLPKKSQPTDFIQNKYEYNGILQLFLEL